MRAARVAFGLVLLWGSLGVLGYRLGWEAHARRGQHALLGAALGTATHDATSCSSSGPVADGQLAGVLSIPRLGVVAPVEGGTSDAVLGVAVGHADGTPWPGTSGDAVLLAHDVSYFAQLGQLSPGDTIDYTTGCLTETFGVVDHEVVRSGSPIPSVPGSAVVLDTCWPTDALWYTPDRYLVEAVERSVSTTPQAGGLAAIPEAPSFPTQFSTPAPPELAATGLSLEQNEEPMGTLTLGGTPATSWAQSPAPLGVEAGALAAYFGALHAIRQEQPAWWSAVAPGVPAPGALEGASAEGWGASPLDVSITVDGTTPTAVQLDTVMPFSGGPDPGTYRLQVTEEIHGTSVVITDWEFADD